MTSYYWSCSTDTSTRENPNVWKKRDRNPRRSSIPSAIRPHPLDVFIAMLLANEITHLLDVRTIPRSRRNPQFNQETLASALRASNIDYRHLPGLGGLRHARKDSINGGWRNASFRGYADYMQTPDFASNIKIVLAMAASGPWR